MTQHLVVDPTIADPLSAGLVVALESTIITHGMPYPRNVETAIEVEAAVTEAGAVPATIAVVQGQLRVGMSHDELDALARTGTKAAKISRRDLPYSVANQVTAGTTVASTMFIAAKAGIRVFATGGIGGVHRGAESTFDISADLQELAKTPVAVVSAGFKSILDLGLTLEYLETQGVPVLGMGTNTLPAFYTRESDHQVDYRVDSADDVARLIRTADDLELDNGMVVANPIPHEHSLDRDTIDAAIKQAIRDAEKAGIERKDTTPYLLERIAKITGANSLAANIELVLNNARLGGAIAVQLARRART